MFGYSFAMGADEGEEAGTQRLKDHADMDWRGTRVALGLVIKCVEELDNVLMPRILIDRVDEAEDPDLVTGSRCVADGEMESQTRYPRND
ncbi:hypothetical protein AG1IA_04201 [Rhizoctonia solani AG-1 IA]|uniref:Uncharacterized protein n=1 Tax=Thanatephorus cucumeris (strain AG1-IA) TaxID=983506 RepID=L8WYF6_THACA|nr:hypothetical protein AG1IA_04201 [Rhizoctonia solani AG-1 IA]